MMMVRHGVMLIGQAAVGKTVAIDLLSKCMDKKVKSAIMNPKAVEIHQFYGMFDSETKTW